MLDKQLDSLHCICLWNKLQCHAVTLNPGLTLQVAGDIVLDLLVAWGAEEQSPVHQRELLEHRQRPVAQRTVHYVSLARAEGRQDEPGGRGAWTK